MRSHLRVILLALLALCVAPLRASADMSDAVRCAARRPPRARRVASRRAVAVACPLDRFAAKNRTSRGSHQICRASIDAPPRRLTAPSLSPPRLSHRWVRTDYYGALNVSKSANATEIKSKYRRLALQYHPDKLGHLTKSQQKSAEKIFKVPPAPHGGYRFVVVSWIPQYVSVVFLLAARLPRHQMTNRSRPPLPGHRRGKRGPHRPGAQGGVRRHDRDAPVVRAPEVG